jgi:hypothetical protein
VQACLVQEAAGVAKHGHLGEQLHVGAARREEVGRHQLLSHAVQLAYQLPPLCTARSLWGLMMGIRMGIDGDKECYVAHASCSDRAGLAARLDLAPSGHGERSRCAARRLADLVSCPTLRDTAVVPDGADGCLRARQSELLSCCVHRVP